MPLTDLLLTSVFNILPGAYLLLTPEGLIEAVSDDYLAATLTTREQLVDRNLFDAFPDNPAGPVTHAIDNLRTSIDQVLATGQLHQMDPQHHDVPDPRQPGRFVERHWLCTNRPVHSSDGRVTHVLHFAVDVTAQQQTEHCLREAQAAERAIRADAEAQRNDLRDFVEHAPVAVAVYRGPEFRVELANATTLAIWDRSLEDVLGRPVFNVLPEADTPEVRAIFERVFATGVPHTAQEQPTFIDRHGQREMVYWNFVFQPERQSDGRISGIRSVGTEVTEQVQARQQLEQLNQHLEARVEARTAQLRHHQRLLPQIMRQVPAAIATLSGPEHRYTFFNDAYHTLSGGRARVDLSVAEVLPEIVAQGFIRRLDQVYATGQPFIGTEAPVQLFDAATGQAEPHFVDVIYQPLTDGQGHTEGILAFIVDVTEKVRARQQLDALQQQVLAAAQRQAAERESLYQVFEQTPAAVALLRSPGHRYEYVNPAYQAFFSGRPFVGWEVAEAVPELHAQGFVAMLDRVYQTGESYIGQEFPFTWEPAPGHAPRVGYFNFTFQAYREAGAIAGVSIFAYDVTEQVLARQEREIQRQLLTDVFAQAPAGIWVVRGPDYVFEVINPTMARIIRRTAEQCLGRPYFEVLPELTSQGVPELLRRVWEQGEPVFVEEFAAQLNPQAPDEVGYFTFAFQPLRDEHGQVARISCVALDVTSQVRARRVVEASEQQVRVLVENAPFLIGVYVGPDLRFHLVNQTMLDGLGKGPDVLGKRYADVLPELENHVVIEQMHQVLATGQPLHLRDQRLEVVMHGTPQTFYYNYSFIPLRDAEGQVYGILNTAADVTDLILARQRIESFAAELQESEARFRTMADAAPNMVWAVHPDSSIRYINRAFLDFVGLDTEEEYTATGWGPYLHPDEAARTKQSLSEAIAQRRPYVLEHRMRCHDGQYRWLLAQGAPSYLADGKLYGYVGSAIDITDLKHANEQLTRTNQDLDNFVYAASHDLKQPVNNLAGLLRELQQSVVFTDPSEEQLLVPLVREALQQLSTTIDDLATLGQAQQTSLAFTEKVLLDELTEEIINSLEPQMRTARARITTDFTSWPALSFARANLRTILLNLLGNSLKYADPARPARIHVSMWVEQGRPVLVVEDNGMGFDADKHGTELFQLFQRLHTHTPGTGVGLYLVHRIVQAAGGTIEVDSQPGEGATFRIRFGVN